MLPVSLGARISITEYWMTAKLEDVPTSSNVHFTRSLFHSFCRTSADGFQSRPFVRASLDAHPKNRTKVKKTSILLDRISENRTGKSRMI